MTKLLITLLTILTLIAGNITAACTPRYSTSVEVQAKHGPLIVVPQQTTEPPIPVPVSPTPPPPIP